MGDILIKYFLLTSYFVFIRAIIISSDKAIKIDTQNKIAINCLNPSNEILLKHLSNAYKRSLLSNENSESVYKSNAMSNEALNNETILATHGDKRCSRTEQTKWDGNNDAISLCPHHFVEVSRTDRYPFKRLKAVCNCEGCLQLDESTMKCMPIFMNTPALQRGRCKSDGIYEWTETIEKVPISCTCSRVKRAI